MDSATEAVWYYHRTRPPLDPETETFRWVLSTETADYAAVAVDETPIDWEGEGALLYGSPVRVDEAVVGLNSEYVT